jgi:hypothetical protein
MRIEKQNRRSCIALLVLLALLAALVLWMSLGGYSSETVGDDVKADVDGPNAPGGALPPGSEAGPAAPARPPS